MNHKLHSFNPVLIRVIRGPLNTASRILGVVVVVALVAQMVLAQLPVAKPESVSVSTERLTQMDAVINQEISNKRLPGAVVLVGCKGRIVWHKAYGSRAVEPSREPMTPDTIFDLASLTKVVATATSIMILVERGKLRLTDPVSLHIPELKGEGRDRITVEQLLTHVSGYAPDFDLRERWTGYDEAIKRLIKEPLRNPPGSRFTYSDIGFIALGEVVARVGGMSLDQFAQKNIFAPLRMTNTGFRPSSTLTTRIAPTEKRRGQLSYLGDSAANSGAEGELWLRGEVHDPTSYRMNGVAGHAGLFSTANDLAIYCQMILNGGSFGGVRVLAPLTVAEMTRPRLISNSGGTRGLGWDINTSFSTNRGELFPLGSFGHTGFTGTSVWIDRVSQTFVVFMSNRVHPDGKGDVSPLRARVATVVAGSVTDTAAVERAREQSAKYYSELVKSLQQFAFRYDGAGSSTKVLTGIDVLGRDNFKPLAGMRVGL